MSQTRRPRQVNANVSSELQLLRCGEYILDNEMLDFMAPGGRKFSCTKLEHKILAALMKAQGRPVPIERLMLQVYGQETWDHPDQATIRVTFSNIRKKMRAAGIPDTAIRSVNSVGYSIDAGTDEIEVLLLDRPRMMALDAVLQAAASTLPEEVALLRRAA